MKPLKTLIRIGLVLLVVVTVALAVRAIFNFTEGRKLARTLGELKERGIPLTARDLAVPCPDSDNAARLWKAAENLLEVGDDDKGILNRSFLDLAAGKPMDPSLRAALADLIAKNERALGLVHEMADKPCFLYRDPRLPLIEAMSPGMVKMITVTRLLGFDALLRADEGDVPGAIEKIRSGLRFTPRVAGEGMLMTQLIAVANTRMLVEFLAAVCRGRAIDESLLRELAVELEPDPWRKRLSRAIQGDSVLIREAAAQASRGTRMENAFFFGEPSRLNDIRVWLIRPFLKTDLRKTLPELLELEAQALLPYYESRGSLRTRTQQLETRPWYAYLSKALLGNFEAAFLKEAQLEASLLAARTGLACKLYKGRTGEYPEALGALVPGILKEVPIDPFTGKPLVYRKEGKGFIVYSLGSNEKDDNGRSTYMITQMVMDKDDDWTWRESK